MLLWGIDMWDKIKKFFHDLITEPDNAIVCPVRVMAILGFLYSLGTHAWTVFAQHVAFDLQSFSTAYGIMMATLGAALKIKSDSKPDGGS